MRRETSSDFHHHVDNANDQVNSWPDWKKDSMKLGEFSSASYPSKELRRKDTNSSKKLI